MNQQYGSPRPAATLALVLAGLSAIHVYWAAGGTAASTGVVPEVAGRATINPGAGATVVVAALLALGSLTALGRGGIVTVMPAGLARAGTFIMTGLFAARAIGDFRTVGFTKRVRNTKFARLDDRIFSPLCVAISALALGSSR